MNAQPNSLDVTSEVHDLPLSSQPPVQPCSPFQTRSQSLSFPRPHAVFLPGPLQLRVALQKPCGTGSFNKHLLSTCDLPGTERDAGDMAVSRHTIPALTEVTGLLLLPALPPLPHSALADLLPSLQF